MSFVMRLVRMVLRLAIITTTLTAIVLVLDALLVPDSEAPRS
jgi:hypothetical protein